MNHHRWTYIGANGNAIVRLVHQLKTGKLLLYYNKEIILADKDVFDSRSLSFFINDELCRVEIIKSADTFHYQFIIDNEIATPLNKARKKLAKKDWLYSLLFIGGLMSIFGGAIYGGYAYTQHKKAEELAQYGVETIGQVAIKKIDGRTYLRCLFEHNGRTYITKLEDYEHSLKTKFGMPLVSGDRFKVTYASINPPNNKVDLENLLEVQKEHYRLQIIQQHQAQDSSITFNYLACLLDVAYNIKENASFADFYYFNTPSTKNRQHNKTTYKAFINSKNFREQLGDCLDYQ